MGFMQHLLTFMHVYQPGWFFRWSVIATQGIFMNTFFVVSESKAVVWWCGCGCGLVGGGGDGVLTSGSLYSDYLVAQCCLVMLLSVQASRDLYLLVVSAMRFFWRICVAA